MPTVPNTTTDLSSGAVRRSIRYLRVSSKRQMDTDADRDPEGNSIDTQRKVTTAKERAMGTVNVGEYVEPGNSAQSIDKRPVFKEMLRRIIEQRDVDYVVIYMRSRAFRNYVEAGIVKQQLAKLGVKLISAKEDFGDGIMGEAMEAVTDVFNWLQVRMSGEDIRVKMANKARNGGTIARAKVGYRNQRLLIDDHEMREPFDILTEAYQIYTIQRGVTNQAQSGISGQTDGSFADAVEREITSREELISSLALALGGQGWSKPVWVDLSLAYSKRSDLAASLVRAVDQLQRAQRGIGPAIRSVRTTRQSTHDWRVGDRLSEADERQLVVAFTAGTSKRKLAELYGISESSVKRLIRRHGASKQSNGS